MDWELYYKNREIAEKQFDFDYEEFLLQPTPACSRAQGKRLILRAGNMNQGGGVSGTDSLKEFFPLLSADMIKTTDERYSHEEMKRRVKALLQTADEKSLAEGYIYGVTHKEGREYILPFLGYHYFKNLPEHEKQPAYSAIGGYEDRVIPFTCGYCGYFDARSDKETARSQFTYALAYAYMLYRGGAWFSFGANEALYSLEMSAQFPKVRASKEDFAKFLAAVRLAETIPPTKKCGAYNKALREAKIFPQTKDEVQEFINTLGILNILHPKDMFGYAEKYTPRQEQKEPSEYKNDYVYPVNHWLGADGVDHAMIEKLFGKLDCYQL